ncbi:Rho-GAP domain-containing protein [Psidium guajava]|nr:Rho-GAP domain-containing protein [Psidium guajava]
MHLVHRSSKSTSDAANLSPPLLKESFDGEFVSISLRHSLSSSSSRLAGMRPIAKLLIGMQSVTSSSLKP